MASRPESFRGITLVVAFLAFLLLVHAAQAQNKSKVEIVPQIPHADSVLSVAFSPNGARVLSASVDTTIKLWDAATGALLRTFAGHSQMVTSVAITHDGGRLLSGSHDNMLKLWDTATGALLRTFEGHSHPVESVAFSPNGARVLSGSHDKTLRLWDAATGKQLRVLAGHMAEVTSVAFSPDGSRLLSGSRDKTLKLWDAATGRLLRTFTGESSPVNSVAFSPDGTRVLSGSDLTIKLWDARTGELLRIFEGHSFTVASVAFSPDGARVLSGSWDKTMKLWDTATGRLLRTFEGNTDVTVNSVAFSPNGTRVLAGSTDRTMRLWDAATGNLLRIFGGHSASVNSVAFSPDATRVLSGSGNINFNTSLSDKDDTMKLWDAATGRLLRTFEGHTDAINSVVFSADGIHALSGSQDNTLKLWNTATGALLYTVAAHSGSVRSVAFSPDGARMLSGGFDKTMRLWNTATGQLLRTFEADLSEPESVAFSRDGAHVLFGDQIGKIFLWDAATGKLLHAFEGHPGDVVSVAFSPDGTRVLSGGGNTVNLWNASTGALLRTFEGQSWSVTSAFSPDGSRVLSGSEDRAVKLWDATTGALLHAFVGHSGRVLSVAFSSDGTRALSGGDDGTVRIWNISTSQPLATLFAGADGKWLTMTPAGFFAASPKGGQALAVVRGLQAYDINQMYQALYDPDLVREELSGDPDGEVKKAAGILDLQKVVDSGQAPETVLARVSDGTSTHELVTAQANITDAGGGIGRVEWRVNGITVAVLSSAPGRGTQRTVTQSLALEPGENTIEVVAYNGRNLLASPPAIATVTWNAPDNQPKPRLFVIAVGINDYRDTLFRRLSFAVADAKAFGAAMKVASEGLYADVDVTYVLNADATARNLDRVIDEVGAKMNPRDTFIFFAASHGKSENGRFHMIPQDYRSNAPGTLADKAIGQDRLQDWFANRINARRGLILFDTCESGALVASRASGIDLANSEASMGRLNEATGRPVLTAAAADQSALEGYKGHGVFTYALLDALVNGDTNNDGQIELSELAAHIQELAPKLSQELRDRRGQATTPVSKSRAAEQLGGAAIAARYQKPKMGSRGEDFPLVRHIQALPAAAVAP
jgi:WD40 repeat protein